jgi:hypothetical protein
MFQGDHLYDQGDVDKTDSPSPTMTRWTTTSSKSTGKETANGSGTIQPLARGRQGVGASPPSVPGRPSRLMPTHERHEWDMELTVPGSPEEWPSPFPPGRLSERGHGPACCSKPRRDDPPGSKPRGSPRGVLARLTGCADYLPTTAARLLRDHA